MKWKPLSRAVAGSVATASLVVVGLLAAPAAQAVPQYRQFNGSASQTFVYNGNFSAPLSESASYRVVGAVVKLGADLNKSALICPAGATKSRAFGSIEQPLTAINLAKFIYGTPTALAQGGAIDVSAGNGNLTVATLVGALPTTTSRYWIGYECLDAQNVVVSQNSVAQRFYRTIQVDSAGGWIMFPDAALGGSLDIVAPIALTYGELGMTIAAGSVTLGAPTFIGGQSVSAGNMPTITVSDTRGAPRPGWSLSVSVPAFVNTTNAALSVESANLSVTPSILKTDQGAIAGSSFTGSATVARTLASAGNQAAGSSTDVAAALSLTAPVGTPAGNYKSTVALTLVSK